MNIRMSLFACIVVCVALGGAAQAEMIINGDFEAGISGWGSWGSGSGSGPSGYLWTNHWAFIEPSGGSDGGQFMNCTTAAQIGYLEWWGWGYNVIWREALEEVIPVTPGETVAMGAWYKDLSGNGGGAILKFEWLDENMVKDQDGGLVPSFEIVVNPTTDWAYYEETQTVPDLAHYIRPVWGVNSAGSEIGVDQVYYVPEPATIGLLGLGALWLRRRKR